MNDHAQHVRDWVRWFRLNNHNHHVLAWWGRRPLRMIDEARERLQSIPSERLERLSDLGFLDAYSELAADQVISERRRKQRIEE